MIRISGFFSLHGNFSFNAIAPAIEETRAIFSHEGKNVLIQECLNTDSTSYPKFVHEVFVRSAGNDNLYRMWEECKHESQHDRLEMQSWSENEIRRNVLELNKAFPALMLRLSDLRKKVDFQLLHELCPTAEVEALQKEFDKAEAEYLSIWGVDFDMCVNNLAEMLRLSFELAPIRDRMVRRQIDNLIGQYPSLNIQVFFGTCHKNMLDPYQERKDVSVRAVVLDEPGASWQINMQDVLNAGYALTAEQKQLNFLWIMMMDVSEEMRIKSRIIAHCGDFFEVLSPLLSGLQFRSFFGLSDEAKLLRTAKLVKDVGAFDALYARNPKAADFLRTLADARKPLAQNTSRNEPCPCGSGKKYKKCCGK